MQSIFHTKKRFPCRSHFSSKNTTHQWAASNHLIECLDTTVQAYYKRQEMVMLIVNKLLVTIVDVHNRRRCCLAFSTVDESRTICFAFRVSSRSHNGFDEETNHRNQNFSRHSPCSSERPFRHYWTLPLLPAEDKRVAHIVIQTQ